MDESSMGGEGGVGGPMKDAAAFSTRTRCCEFIF